MTATERSLFVFALYMVFVAGVGLMVFPVALPAIFGVASEDPDWARMVGLLAFIIGIYYLLAVRARLAPFYPWTVPLRLFAAVFMTGLVMSGGMEPSLMLFALIDASGAVWTWRTLRRRATA